MDSEVYNNSAEKGKSMTSEIVQFKCPSCGQKLTEEEYWHVCQIQKSHLDQMVKKEVEQKTEQIEQRYVMKIQHLEDENKRKIQDREVEIQRSVSKLVNEKKLQLEKQYSEKEKQLEAAQIENDKLIELKISQAIMQNEVKHRQKEKESELKYSRVESINRELINKVGKLETALNNIPPEFRGTAGELVLQDELHKEFIDDKFMPKKVGIEMADVVQTIVTESGHPLRMPIAYDKKMGDTVTKLDLEKAKRYKTIHNTDYVVIVTAKGVRNNRFTEMREGILLVHPIVLIDVARMLRTLIIQTEKYAKNSEALETKQAEIYDYVTSQEYNRAWELKLDIKSQLDELQTSDDRRHKQTSEKRRKLIDRLYELIDRDHFVIRDILEGDQIEKEDTSDLGRD